MQILSDVTGRRIRIAKATEGSALGSAIFAAACAEKARGGYGDLFQAIRAMGHCEEHEYTPNPAHREIYDLLYPEYHRLHDYFGRGENPVMKKLAALRRRGGSGGGFQIAGNGKDHDPKEGSVCGQKGYPV